jgi:general secretion pathway protein J
MWILESFERNGKTECWKDGVLQYSRPPLPTCPLVPCNGRREPQDLTASSCQTLRAGVGRANTLWPRPGLQGQSSTDSTSGILQPQQRIPGKSRQGRPVLPGPDLACRARALQTQPLKYCSHNNVFQASRARAGQYSKKNSGFTLLEIMVAIFIFAVVLTTIYTSYTGTFRVVDETESQAEIYRMARIAIERMLEDLESIYIPKGEENPKSEEDTLSRFQFLGEDREIEGRSADNLRFTSRAHLNLGGQEQESGAAEIAYYLKEKEEGDDLVLYRIDRAMFEEVSPSDERTGGLVLCERLVSVNFTYYDENGEARESWDSLSDALRGKIPKMVSIALEFVNSLDPEAPLKFMTSVVLPLEERHPW